MQKQVKQLFLLSYDTIAIALSLMVAFLIRFEGEEAMILQIIEGVENPVFIAAAILLIKIIVFSIFKMYSSLWRYASVEEILTIVKANVAATLSVVTFLTAVQESLPRSIYLLTFILDMAFTGGIRISYRALRNHLRVKGRHSENIKRVLILGGGEAASLLVKEYRTSPTAEAVPVGILDDDPDKQGFRINGVKVCGRISQVEQVARDLKADEIILAIPSLSAKAGRDILRLAGRTGLRLRTLPGVMDLAEGKVAIKEIRDVAIEDLLGREEVALDHPGMMAFIQGKHVLVTGGGGSIGSELCRQVSHFKPSKVTILEICENNAYFLQRDLSKNYPEITFEVVIASVRDDKRIDQLFEKEGYDLVFHAAAHKHVPLMEANPQEAVKNNVLGTLNVINSARIHGVEKFVLVSTDKAVNPTNVMGATKRIAEMLVQIQPKGGGTDFAAVRFGNVLGSSGSVIPLFKEQIRQGGPVTLTHEEIIRYFMTIPEASRLVLQAGAMATGGEIFVLDMGEPVKIKDLAENLIRLSGFEPYVDIDIQITGLRPGEKLYEELLMDPELNARTDHLKIYVEKPTLIRETFLKKNLNHLRRNIHDLTLDQIREVLMDLVPTYRPEAGPEPEEAAAFERRRIERRQGDRRMADRRRADPLGEDLVLKKDKDKWTVG